MRGTGYLGGATIAERPSSIRLVHDAYPVMLKGRSRRKREALIDVARGPLSVVLVTRLMLTGIWYGRSLRNEGLARTVVHLQRQARRKRCEYPAPVLHGSGRNSRVYMTALYSETYMNLKARRRSPAECVSVTGL